MTINCPHCQNEVTALNGVVAMICPFCQFAIQLKDLTIIYTATPAETIEEKTVRELRKHTGENWCFEYGQYWINGGSMRKYTQSEADALVESAKRMQADGTMLDHLSASLMVDRKLRAEDDIAFDKLYKICKNYESQLTARNNDVAEMVEALTSIDDHGGRTLDDPTELWDVYLKIMDIVDKTLAKYATPDDKDVG